MATILRARAFLLRGRAFLGQFRNQHFGGLLAGGFLGGAAGAGREMLADARFDSEDFSVVGAAGLDDGVLGWGKAEFLGALVEHSFVVEQASRFHGFPAVEDFKDMLDGKAAGGIDAAIGMNGGDDGFEGVRQQSAALAPTIPLFPLAEAQMLTEIQAEGALIEVGRADELSFPLGKLAFTDTGVAGDEAFADDEAEYRIAQKLKLFVVAVFRKLRAVLGKPGAVSQGAQQERAIAEPVAQFLFERLYRGLHRSTVTWLLLSTW